MFLLAIGGAKTVLSICRAETLNCGSNFTNCQDYVGVIRISAGKYYTFCIEIFYITLVHMILPPKKAYILMIKQNKVLH